MATLGQRAIGSIVRLRVGGVFTNFVVVQQGSPSTAYQGFENRTVLLMERCWENRQMHSSNVNDYQNSSLNTWLNGTFFNMLDADIRNQIAQVRIPFRPGSGTSANVNIGANGLLTRIFLLSQREVGIANGLPGVSGWLLPNNEGVRFAWFIDGNVAGPQTERRVAVLQNGNAANWWLRSPWLLDSLHFWGVLSSGHAHSAWDASSSIGVRPALTLPSSLFVSDSGDVAVIQPPTMPPSINVPTNVLGGGNLSVSWGASTDPQGQAITYTLQRQIDGGTWVQSFSGSGLSTTNNIPAGTATVAFRVSARNTSGLESGHQTSPTRDVINNQPPSIDGADVDLGVQTGAFTHNYVVTDPDVDDILTVVERLNGVQLRQFTATNGATNILSVSQQDFLALSNGTHILTITASDQLGQTVVRTLTFSRNEAHIEILLESPRPANDMPVRAAVTVNRQIPEGALFSVEICNNAYDDNPTWEDCTQAVLDMGIYLFQNTINTTSGWGVNIRVNVSRNGATGPCWVSSIGGAFDNIILSNG